MTAEVIVDPAAMAADCVSPRQQVMDPFLRFGIVENVEPLVVSEFIDVGPGREVDGELATIENTFICQNFERPQRRVRIDVPVEHQPTDAVRNRDQIRETQHVDSEGTSAATVHQYAKPNILAEDLRIRRVPVLPADSRPRASAWISAARCRRSRRGCGRADSRHCRIDRWRRRTGCLRPRVRQPDASGPGCRRYRQERSFRAGYQFPAWQQRFL